LVRDPIYFEFSVTEPPVKVVYPGRFHTGAEADLWAEPHARTYRQTARRIAFRALTSGEQAAQLLHVFRTARPGHDVTDDHHVMGSWLIADPAGKVTAHRGLYVGVGGSWHLADVIIPGSAHAVQPPTLNGYYRARPDAYRELVANHAASHRCLQERHAEAVAAAHLYAEMTFHPALHFTPLLRAAIAEGGVQGILHDWLEEQGFPHAEELRIKKRNRGRFTEGQFLDLLTKPLDSTRRSFSGRTVESPPSP
jgi:hypothetical protein